MPPTIAIAAVTPAEYPLLQAVRDVVFGELGHVLHASVAEAMSGRQDVLALLARTQDVAVGLCTGYRSSPAVYYVNYIGMRSEFRRGGAGREMMLQQERFAESRGYRQIQFNTFNHFPGMLRLGLSLGYRPIGVEQHEGTNGDLAIRFGKSLAGGKETSSMRSAAIPASGSIEIPCEDSAMLRHRLDEGASILGLIRHPQDGRLFLQMSAAR